MMKQVHSVWGSININDTRKDAHRRRSQLRTGMMELAWGLVNDLRCDSSYERYIQVGDNHRSRHFRRIDRWPKEKMVVRVGSTGNHYFGPQNIVFSER